MPDRDEAIAQLRQTPAKLRELATTAPDAALDFRPTPDSWSVREVLAHLVDDEMFIMRMRLERMIKEDKPHLTPHDEKRWYATRNTSRDDLALLLGDFDTQRAATLNIIGALRDSDWSREGFQPEYGDLTVESWLDSWAAHDRVHIEQISGNLASYQERT